MKLKLIVISFLLLSQAAFAQTDDDLKPEHQIGVNATLFIKQFLSFNDNVFNSSPYSLTYKYIDQNEGWRIGLGGSNTSSKSNPNNGTNITSNTNINIDARLGYEWQKKLDKRWLMYYGLDGIYSYSKFRSTSSIQSGGFPPKTEEVISSTEDFGFGGGPILGMEFKINKRISLNAETAAYFNYRETRIRDINTAFVGFQRNEFTANTSLFINLPTAIFFIITI
ncbi:MAG: outer membrane beta-barrel protein [Bacteroidota bacterium]